MTLFKHSKSIRIIKMFKKFTSQLTSISFINFSSSFDWLLILLYMLFQDRISLCMGYLVISDCNLSVSCRLQIFVDILQSSANILKFEKLTTCARSFINRAAILDPPFRIFTSCLLILNQWPPKFPSKDFECGYFTAILYFNWFFIISYDF